MITSTPAPVVTHTKEGKVTTTTQKVYNLLRSDARPLPTASMPRSFTAHNTSDIANASTHFAGDPQYAKQYPNAICVTSLPTANANELCTFAYSQQQNGDSPCSWKGSYLVSMDNDKIPAGGPLECGHPANGPDDVCLPKGTKAYPCALNDGVNVGGGNFSLTPSYIAIPASQADMLLNGYGNCYSKHPSAGSKPYGYTKTSNFQVAFSNPNDTSV